MIQIFQLLMIEVVLIDLLHGLIVFALNRPRHKLTHDGSFLAIFRLIKMDENWLEVAVEILLELIDVTASPQHGRVSQILQTTK